MNTLQKDSTFAIRFREAMTKLGISQSEVCRRTNLPRSTISRYTLEKNTPKQSRIKQLANALGVNEAWLEGYNCDMKATIILNDDYGSTKLSQIDKVLGYGLVRQVYERVKDLDDEQLRTIIKYIDIFVIEQK